MGLICCSIKKQHLEEQYHEQKFFYDIRNEQLDLSFLTVAVLARGIKKLLMISYQFSRKQRKGKNWSKATK